jgi:ADP-sugar diphosphatase
VNPSEENIRLPGICFLRGNGVSILVALFCNEDDEENNTTGTSSKIGNSVTNQYCILVEQPRVPIGLSSIYEIPAGMLDDENESVVGIAVKEMEEECGLQIHPYDLIDLTELALEETVHRGYLPIPAIAPSPGGCDEFIRYMYLEKNVTKKELHEMKGRLTGLRDHGEYITLHVVPMNDVWKISGDAKAMM